jgi:hypothetical protein
LYPAAKPVALKEWAGMHKINSVQEYCTLNWDAMYLHLNAWQKN